MITPDKDLNEAMNELCLRCCNFDNCEGVGCPEMDLIEKAIIKFIKIKRVMDGVI